MRWDDDCSSWCRGPDEGTTRRAALRTAALEGFDDDHRPPQQGHGGDGLSPHWPSDPGCFFGLGRYIPDGTGAAISSLARAMLALQPALASSP